MQSRILSRRDLSFLLYEWLDAESLTGRERYADHSRETFDAVLDVSERIATEFFATHNKIGDQNEARLESGKVRLAPEVGVAIKAYTDAGLMAAANDYEHGGMQLPALVERASFAWFAAANAATSAFALLTIGNANLILAYGSKSLIEQYALPMLSGRYFGTMCLSEPHAGSSLANIRTRADAQAGGSYRIVGSKMWITTGDHEIGENIVHLLLARTADAPQGTRGISLFVVPRFLPDECGNPTVRNDIALAGLNHKMGTKGCPNCLLNFGEGTWRPGGAAGAVGWLLGDPGCGLDAMFHMMNEARIAVGISAAAIAYTGYLHALDYARQRPQGYLPGVRGIDGQQVSIIQHADVRRMLLAQKCYAEGGLALTLYCARLVDEQRTAERVHARDDARLLLDVLTPIAKSWPSQWCLEASSLAIQVHGGYGYTRDYPVEQFYRDNRLNAIHEGTQGIHALDLLGRKVIMQNGAGLTLLVSTIRATFRKIQNDELSAYSARLGALIDRLIPLTKAIHAQVDAQHRLANANAYLEALGHTVVGWIWLEQMIVAKAHEDDDFYRGKSQAGRYFFTWELPKAEGQFAMLESLDTVVVEMRDEWF